jgi:Na+-translocating ferredoxin:NAD+ oxidoreductase RnfG subunit
LAMTFNYFLLSLKMALMHTFTQKLIDEQDAMAKGEVLEESFDDFITRHLYEFVQMRGLDEQQVKNIEQAVLDAKTESKLHVVMVGKVTQDGMGRQINQIKVITDFWYDNFVL